MYSWTREICVPVHINRCKSNSAFYNNGCLIEKREVFCLKLPQLLFWWHTSARAQCAPQWSVIGHTRTTYWGRLMLESLLSSPRPTFGSSFTEHSMGFWLLRLLGNRTMTCFLRIWPASNEQWAKWNYLTCSLCSARPGSVRNSFQTPFPVLTNCGLMMPLKEESEDHLSYYSHPEEVFTRFSANPVIVEMFQSGLRAVDRILAGG